MRKPLNLIVIVILSIMLLSTPVSGYGTGVKTYMPSQTTIVVNSLPFTYNSSFVVYNDGYREGVYIIRVSVSDPAAINWLDLSQSVFTLKPGESRIILVNVSVGADETLAGEQDFVIMPTLLSTNVEPYIDQFASYVSQTDPFTLSLYLPGVPTVGYAATADSGTPVVFFTDQNRTNLPQYSILTANNTVLTQLDRAIRINSPKTAAMNVATPLNVSIFEGLSDQGITLLALAPDGTLYHVVDGSFNFNQEGLWGVMALAGNEFLLGKTVEVSPSASPIVSLLGSVNADTILAMASLLILLAVIPAWLLTGNRVTATDPYSEILFKTYVVRKYIGQFDRQRLMRIVQILKNEYYDLAARGVKGKRAEAKSSIDELDTLAFMD